MASEKSLAGSRIDLHGLHTTFVTQLLASGADPYAVMKLARRGDISHTIGPYADAAQMKFLEKLNVLPSLSLDHAAHIAALAGGISGRLEQLTLAT